MFSTNWQILSHLFTFPDVRLDLPEPRRVPGQLRRDRSQPQGGQASAGGAHPVHHRVQCKYLVLWAI